MIGVPAGRKTVGDGNGYHKEKRPRRAAEGQNLPPPGNWIAYMVANGGRRVNVFVPFRLYWLYRDSVGEAVMKQS